MTVRTRVLEEILDRNAFLKGSRTVRTGLARILTNLTDRVRQGSLGIDRTACKDILAGFQGRAKGYLPASLKLPENVLRN